MRSVGDVPDHDSCVSAASESVDDSDGQAVSLVGTRSSMRFQPSVLSPRPATQLCQSTPSKCLPGKVDRTEFDFRMRKETTRQLDSAFEVTVVNSDDSGRNRNPIPERMPSTCLLVIRTFAKHAKHSSVGDLCYPLP